MDLQKAAREIGFFETGINLSKVCGSADVLRKAGASMPLPDENIFGKVRQIAAWLHGFGKHKYLFLTPEIAILEELGKLMGREEEILIALPCDLESDAKERVRNNVPRNAKTTILEEPYFPQLYPGNSLMVVCGYAAGGRSMVLPDTYRMVEHYSGFRGKKAFIPYRELDAGVRYDGWMEVSPQKLNTVWRDNT